MLRNRIAVVTGAARGIGKACAEKLAENGAKVAIIYTGNTDEAQQTADVINRDFGAGSEVAKIYELNVTDHDNSKEVMGQIAQDFGGIDIVVNNAGITRDGLLLRMSEEDFDSVINVNLKGVFNILKASVKYLMKSRFGRVINISSVIGLMGNAGQINYAASKSGVIGITKSFAKEYAAKGVTCNAIAPGFIKTAMTDALSDSQKEGILSVIPLKEMGEVEDISNLVVFLASDNARYITGEVIRVDGGMCM